MKHSNLKLKFTRLAGSVGAVFLLSASMSSCQDDLLTGMPSWLGESIYAELEQRGNFTETLKLINAQSEDYASVLKKTGSRTLFAADDEAWAEFYKNNPWGVKSIEEMTEAQKRLLFKGNMIKSAYLVELLGNLPATSSGSEPEEGACMRRASSVDLMDSVPVILKKDYPVVNPVRKNADTGEQIDFWKRVRERDTTVVFCDDDVATMIHFMPKFMLYNRITSQDVEFLTNGEITSNEGAFINGKVIKEKDVTCQNGYIHVVDGVPVPLDNMANVIAANPNFSIYKRLLDRFSYPEYSRALSDEYERLYGKKDSVFVKRYLNERTFSQLAAIDGGTTITNLLPYDPGWNRYVYQSSNSDITFQTDAAVMVVPTDDALRTYLKTDGADLNAKYANAGPGETAWDNAPDEVVLPLLTNTMLKNSTLKTAIPSMFSSINNTASDPMGVSEKDIDRVHWASNGVIYQTNKVYVAPEYVSVYYPCIIRADEDLRMAYTVVNNDKSVSGGEGFYAYLNNTGAKYSYIIPTDNALQNYYDPVSYKRVDKKGESTAVAYRFYVDDKGKIAARPYLVDWTDLDEYGRGKVAETVANGVTVTNETSTGNASSGDAFNHYKDILNSGLCVGLFEPGQRFYSAKNGSPIIVRWEGDKVTGLAGSFQYERGYYVNVEEDQIFDKSESGNGRSYVIDEEPLMSTFVSPYGALTETSEFSSFASLLAGMDIVSKDDGNKHATMDMALKNLNVLSYSIYVPKNETIDELIESHKMPTWDDVDALENCLDGYETTEENEAFLRTELTHMKAVINDFVTYHIQDNAVYIDGDNHNNDVYESQCLDTTTNRFAKIYVNYDRGNQLKVTDVLGNVRTVDNNLNNVLARQYFFNGSTLTGDACSQIYNSSYVVIHQIDAPLYPYANFLYDPAVYDKVMALVEEIKAAGVGGAGTKKLKY